MLSVGLWPYQKMEYRRLQMVLISFILMQGITMQVRLKVHSNVIYSMQDRFQFSRFRLCSYTDVTNQLQRYKYICYSRECCYLTSSYLKIYLRCIDLTMQREIYSASNESLDIFILSKSNFDIFYIFVKNIPMLRYLNFYHIPNIHSMLFEIKYKYEHIKINYRGRNEQYCFS